MWYMELFYSPFVLLQLMQIPDAPVTTTTHPPVYIEQTKGTDNQTWSCPDHSMLYYKDAPNPADRGCYAVGSGPCPLNMGLYALDEKDKFGYCDCNQTSSRTLIYEKDTNMCHPIFTQGYCPEGQWLDIVDGMTPLCQMNPCCKNSSCKEKDLVQYNGTCVEVGNQTTCSKPWEIIGFRKDHRLAGCVPRFEIHIRSITPPKTVKCKPGTYLSFSGKCQAYFEIDD